MQAEIHTIYKGKQKENTQRKPKVYQAGHILRQQKHIFRHIYFTEDAAVGHKRVHTAAG